MSPQDERRTRPPRLVFPREVNTAITSQFEEAFRAHENNQEAAMEAVLNWLWNTRHAEAPAQTAFRQLLDHFIHSALAQMWIDRIEGTFRVEGGGEGESRSQT
jgi:hypothetical protein